ncbi:4'-phosphopantetheinyl transferase family protein [Actinoplanes sp. NPDC051494]|uniref:4'-phosphopantetheinyl transferase family protein n=1 Tax=Actinoplanes sp. NPDC051494 TaxID=3363907 RepID=UPI0037AF716D
MTPRHCPPTVAPDSVPTWEWARGELAGDRDVLLYARLADWLPERSGDGSLRQLLGRDWSCFLELSKREVSARVAATRALLRHASANLADDPTGPLELGYGPTGRPYLRGHPRVDISLSYVDDLVLIGMTTRGLIGIEAERLDRDLYRSGRSRHICSPYELVTLAEVAEGDRNRHLVRLCALKVAYSKAMGLGAHSRLADIGFGPDGRPARARRPDGTPAAGDEWTFRSFVVDGDYLLGAAVYDAGPGPGRE